MKYMQHPDQTYETYTWNAYVSAELDTHGHPSREQQMAHAYTGPALLSWLPTLVILSLLSPRMHGPHTPHGATTFAYAQLSMFYHR